MAKLPVHPTFRYALSLVFLMATPFLLANVVFKNGFEGDPSVIPPDPQLIAPSNPKSGATDLFASTDFLYTGDDPIQTGVTPGTIDARRVAIIRGKVRTPMNGTKLSLFSTVLTAVWCYPHFMPW